MSRKFTASLPGSYSLLVAAAVARLLRSHFSAPRHAGCHVASTEVHVTNMDATGTGATDATAGTDSVAQLNALLRGEISAAETYRMAIDRAAGSDSPTHLKVLGEIQEEHGRAAQQVRDRIRELRGQATESSGAWGAWAKTVQATMSLFGDASSLKALKEGEEHGLHDYNNALGSVDSTSRQLIQNQLIPQQQRHIDLLDQIASSTGKA